MRTEPQLILESWTVTRKGWTDERILLTFVSFKPLTVEVWGIWLEWPSILTVVERLSLSSPRLLAPGDLGRSWASSVSRTASIICSSVARTTSIILGDT